MNFIFLTFFFAIEISGLECESTECGEELRIPVASDNGTAAN